MFLNQKRLERIASCSSCFSQFVTTGLINSCTAPSLVGVVNLQQLDLMVLFTDMFIIKAEATKGPNKEQK